MNIKAGMAVKRKKKLIQSKFYTAYFLVKKMFLSFFRRKKKNFNKIFDYGEINQRNKVKADKIGVEDEPDVRTKWINFSPFCIE